MSVLGPRDGERVAPLGRSSTRKPDLVSVSQRRLILSGGRIRVGDGAIQPSEAFDNRLLLSRLRTALWSSGRLHNDSKAGLFFLVGGGRAATGGAAATAGEAGPRPATNDFRSALRSHGRVDNLFSRILGLVRVAAPLSDVSKHIEQTPGVGLLCCNRMCSLVAACGVPARLFQTDARVLVPFTSGPAGVFPLGLGRQPQNPPFSPAQLLAESYRLYPGNAFDRQIVTRKLGSSGGTHYSLPLALSDLCRAHPEILAQPHRVRILVVLAVLVLPRAPDHGPARRNVHKRHPERIRDRLPRFRQTVGLPIGRESRLAEDRDCERECRQNQRVGYHLTSSTSEPRRIPVFRWLSSSRQNLFPVACSWPPVRGSRPGCS